MTCGTDHLKMTRNFKIIFCENLVYFYWSSGIITEQIIWHGSYDHRCEHATYTFDTKKTVVLDCDHSDIGNIGYQYNQGSWSSLPSGGKVTLNNVTSLVIGDGSYPEGKPSGGVLLTVTIS